MRLLSNARFYDWLQVLTGASKTRLRLKKHFDSFPAGTRILDIGGGTGGIAPYLPPDTRYICLDSDRAKLRGFRPSLPDAEALVADATILPIRSETIDVVISIAVAHHLELVALETMFSEARRVLRSGGQLVFLDPLSGPRISSRIMWGIDRGAHPRSAEELDAVIGKHFTIVRREFHSILHDYVTIMGRKEPVHDNS